MPASGLPSYWIVPCIGWLVHTLMHMLMHTHFRCVFQTVFTCCVQLFCDPTFVSAPDPPVPWVPYRGYHRYTAPAYCALTRGSAAGGGTKLGHPIYLWVPGSVGRAPRPPHP